MRTDTAAVSLDTEKHTVLLGSGETLPYEQALLATGSRARTLDLAGSDLEGVHTLRTIDESRALYDALSEGDQTRCDWDWVDRYGGCCVGTNPR